MGDTKTFTINQGIYKQAHPPIRVTEVQESRVTSSTLNNFMGSVEGGAIGLAPTYGSKGALHTLALASLSDVIILKTGALKSSRIKHSKKPKSSLNHNLLGDKVLCHPNVSTYAFRMDKVATALFCDAGLQLNSAVDLLSVSKGDRNELQTLMDALGGEAILNKDRVVHLFRGDESMKTSSTLTALQAWAACRAATLPSMMRQISRVPRIDTSLFPIKHLQVISKTIRDASRLVALKPDVVKNDVSKEIKNAGGNLQINSERFRSRVMRTAPHQHLEIKTSDNGKVRSIQGQAKGIQGRMSTVSVKAPLKGSSIISVRTIGREAPTMCESLRSNILLRVLQRVDDILSHPFVRRIWFPSEKISWPATPSSLAPATLYFPSSRTLNVSQEKAVNLVLSRKNQDRVALIQGPPGTGKTTVIAASVTSIMASAGKEASIWLVAQSNVAVKNIAEKLMELKFTKFKLLVSKDFHFEWHEHLYGKIDTNLIRSDDFITDVLATSRQLLDSRVILCTLSMLSNDKLATIAQIVPPDLVIFDEASQIEIGGYFPLISRFRKSINKLVFIGDDKQLAPYGHADINELESIFEIPHLRGSAVFLDTQYRMPVPIGNFISANVYNGKLQSEHKLKSMLKTCRFADIHNGVEVSSGHSWTNDREVQAAIAIARKLDKRKMTYRIITPYDPQRSNLERALKEAKLPWEDKCFNIDAFQGNEADYIIISLVRSEKLGFLKENRRVNVMLTRCKKGMIICTSRNFIESKAQASLVGKLAQSLGDETWVEGRKVLYGTFVPFT